MESIIYIDRESKALQTEKIYGDKALKFLYGQNLLCRILGAPFLPFIAKSPFISAAYGFWQRLPITRKKIAPFIEKFEVDPSEFLEPIESFRSFNDFFVRKLKPEARPIAPGNETAIIPADGRYFFYQNIAEASGFVVKGQKFSLESLLQDQNMAQEYSQGSMLIARLCPSDYHRYHFPCVCVPSETRLINGWLYSVNPMPCKGASLIFHGLLPTTESLQNFFAAGLMRFEAYTPFKT